MNNIRLLPVVVLAIAALLVFKTIGLVTNGGYVLGGVQQAVAAGAAPAPAHGGGGGGEGGDSTMTMPTAPTIEDTTPTVADPSPTLKPAAAEGGGHGAPTADAHSTEAAPAEGEAAAAAPVAGDAGMAAAATDALQAANANGTYCKESDATINPDGTVVLNGASAEGEGGGGGHGAAPAAEGEAAAAPAEGDAAAAADGHGGTDAAAGDHAAAAGDHAAPAEGEAAAPAAPVDFAASMADCLPSGDAVPVQIDGKGGAIPLVSTDGASATEKALLERLAARRQELQKYEDDLALRSQIVDAAEKRIEERSATLQALETQISTLVDQRKEMESGQFAGIVAMYETMKPKDAANIFNNLDMEVLLRVAKAMSPRKMAPILAVMNTERAQQLTVKMADLADTPVDQMTPADMAALPQIVGQ